MKKNNKNILLFKTLRIDISIIFFLCILIIISINFWFNKIPEIFEGGSKVGIILEKICLSYVSAFIFYFLIVHIKAHKDKININNYILNKVNFLINGFTILNNQLTKESKINLTGKYPTNEEINLIFRSINPKSKAPLLLNILSNDYANWIQYLEHSRQESSHTIENIFLLMPFLDTKLITILTKIEDCTYFRLLPTMSKNPIANKDLTFLETTFLEYTKLIKELEEYRDRKLKHYI
jgi:hypothetical protein